ncbi:MAG: hypothetical protein QGF57_00800, partial [Candidatus Marinimicrobia bacterium]|nr:hypothetical protein [Candidatus Neomarinimicrobiota bacterium]
MNDERYWNIKLLNKWFAISSVVFMVSMIWMFIDDNDDDFKVYQREFRKMEILKAEEKLDSELEAVKQERVQFEEKLQIARTALDNKQGEIETAQIELDNVSAKFYKANMNFLNAKSIVDAEKYQYETVKIHGHGDELKKAEEYYNGLLEELYELKLKKEDFEGRMLAQDASIKNMQAERKLAEDELNQVLKEVNLVDRKLSKLD